MAKYPRIYLAIDNCLFYKRWTSPDEWAAVVRDLGLKYIEASADTELDPLYMGKAYLQDWCEAVVTAEKKHGVKVCNLYSGHGSYTTLGIAHPDQRVRNNLVENFIFPLIDLANELYCGVGFFAHAFNNTVLQTPQSYAKYVDILFDELSKISRYAARKKYCGKVGLEKMYTPHQYPWRNKDTYALLREIKKRSGHDFYFTEDLGHHHNKFQVPTVDMIQNAANGGVWLGTDKAFEIQRNTGDVDLVMEEIQKNPQLFSIPSDSDCYETLRLLGCYSPIIHLQQSNGTTSAHLPFTEEENNKGIVTGEKVLKALKESYDAAEDNGMPKRCDEIYLTLELFSGTTSIMQDVLRDCRESVEYWRKFIPEDGITLDKLI